MAVALAIATLACCEPARAQLPPGNSGISAAPAPATVPSAPSSGAAVQEAPRRENPGLINEIGKLFENRPTLFPALKPIEGFNTGAEDAGKDLPDASKDLPGVSKDLPGMKMPSFEKGREKCPTADNGASNCKAAADALCRGKGYAQGKSTDTDAVEKCSAEALLLSGRKSAPGACRTDYFVTRAWCQ